MSEPSAEVFNIDDYRAPSQSGAPCTVTFFGAQFGWEAGTGQRLMLSVTAENGDAAAVIDYVRRRGGAYMPDRDGESWFMPWPPAAIRIVNAE